MNKALHSSSQEFQTERQSTLLFWALTLIVACHALVIAILRRSEGDFWVYSSFLAELYHHPLHPAHPIAALPPIKLPYWPFLMVARWIGLTFGLTSESAMLAMGIPNALLLMCGLRAFICGRYRDELSVPVALAGILFLWLPGNLWFHSNFFHYEIFSVALCYPATAALGLSFYSFEWFRRALTRPGNWYTALCMGSASLSVLIHPLTGMFCILGIFSVAATAQSPRRSLPTALCVALVAFAIAAWWPLYPLLAEAAENKLFSRGGGRVLYENIIQRLAPPLIFALPLFLNDFRSRADKMLAFLCLGALGIYVFGGITGSWNLGRYASFVAIAAQIRVALALRRCELEYVSPSHPPLLTWTIFALLAYWFVGGDAVPNKTLCSASPPCAAATVAGDILLAPPPLALCFASQGVKTVVIDRAFYFPGTFEQRMRDAEQFFSEAVSAEQASRIIADYGVSAIAYAREMPAAKHIAELFPGTATVECESIVLKRISN